MTKPASSLAAIVVLVSGLAVGAPAERGRPGRLGLVRDVLTKYKAENPEGHAELMKLRTADPQAFRSKVSKLVRDAAAKDPELKKRLANPGQGPKFQMPETVKVVRDIVHARYGDREVKLDLYLPKDPPAGKLPCIMVIHGGGWRSGDKERFARFAARFAEKGFAAPCVGYRLIPEVQVRQCVQDVKASVRWVRANAEKYNIDSERIGAFGGSAGAHLAAMLGTSFKAAQLEGAGGNEGVSSRVHAVVSMATPADLSAFGRAKGQEDAKLISPAAYVDSDSARFLLMHCKGDGVVPYKQSLILQEKLEKVKVPVRLITIDGKSHAFWNGTSSVAAKALTDAVEFFEQALKGRMGKPVAPARGTPG
ncbi:MAG: alpha/beta hydrolase [Phycisphaerae bacterium]